MSNQWEHFFFRSLAPKLTFSENQLKEMDLSYNHRELISLKTMYECILWQA